MSLQNNLQNNNLNNNLLNNNLSLFLLPFNEFSPRVQGIADRPFYHKPGYPLIALWGIKWHALPWAPREGNIIDDTCWCKRSSKEYFYVIALRKPVMAYKSKIQILDVWVLADLKVRLDLKLGSVVNLGLYLFITLHKLPAGSPVSPLSGMVKSILLEATLTLYYIYLPRHLYKFLWVGSIYTSGGLTLPQYWAPIRMFGDRPTRYLTGQGFIDAGDFTGTDTIRQVPYIVYPDDSFDHYLPRYKMRIVSNYSYNNNPTKLGMVWGPVATLNILYIDYLANRSNLSKSPKKDYYRCGYLDFDETAQALLAWIHESPLQLYEDTHALSALKKPLPQIYVHNSLITQIAEYYANNVSNRYKFPIYEDDSSTAFAYITGGKTDLSRYYKNVMFADEPFDNINFFDALYLGSLLLLTLRWNSVFSDYKDSLFCVFDSSRSVHLARLLSRIYRKSKPLELLHIQTILLQTRFPLVFLHKNRVPFCIAARTKFNYHFTSFPDKTYEYSAPPKHFPIPFEYSKQAYANIRFNIWRIPLVLSSNSTALKYIYNMGTAVKLLEDISLEQMLLLFLNGLLGIIWPLLLKGKVARLQPPTVKMAVPKLTEDLYPLNISYSIEKRNLITYAWPNADGTYNVGIPVDVPDINWLWYYRELDPKYYNKWLSLGGNSEYCIPGTGELPPLYRLQFRLPSLIRDDGGFVWIQLPQFWLLGLLAQPLPEPPNLIPKVYFGDISISIDTLYLMSKSCEAPLLPTLDYLKEHGRISAAWDLSGSIPDCCSDDELCIQSYIPEVTEGYFKERCGNLYNDPNRWYRFYLFNSGRQPLDLLSFGFSIQECQVYGVYRTKMEKVIVYDNYGFHASNTSQTWYYWGWPQEPYGNPPTSNIHIVVKAPTRSRLLLLNETLDEDQLINTFGLFLYDQLKNSLLWPDVPCPNCTDEDLDKVRYYRVEDPYLIPIDGIPDLAIPEDYCLDLTDSTYSYKFKLYVETMEYHSLSGVSYTFYKKGIGKAVTYTDSDCYSSDYAYLYDLVIYVLRDGYWCPLQCDFYHRLFWKRLRAFMAKPIDLALLPEPAEPQYPCGLNCSPPGPLPEPIMCSYVLSGSTWVPISEISSNISLTELCLDTLKPKKAVKTINGYRSITGASAALGASYSYSYLASRTVYLLDDMLDLVSCTIILKYKIALSDKCLAHAATAGLLAMFNNLNIELLYPLLFNYCDVCKCLEPEPIMCSYVLSGSTWSPINNISTNTSETELCLDTKKAVKTINGYRSIEGASASLGASYSFRYKSSRTVYLKSDELDDLSCTITLKYKVAYSDKCLSHAATSELMALFNNLNIELLYPLLFNYCDVCKCLPLEEKCRQVSIAMQLSVLNVQLAQSKIALLISQIDSSKVILTKCELVPDSITVDKCTGTLIRNISEGVLITIVGTIIWTNNVENYIVSATIRVKLEDAQLAADMIKSIDIRLQISLIFSKIQVTGQCKPTKNKYYYVAPSGSGLLAFCGLVTLIPPTELLSCYVSSGELLYAMFLMTLHITLQYNLLVRIIGVILHMVQADKGQPNGYSMGSGWGIYVLFSGLTNFCLDYSQDSKLDNDLFDLASKIEERIDLYAESLSYLDCNNGNSKAVNLLVASLYILAITNLDLGD